jgi:hypothetical protein
MTSGNEVSASKREHPMPARMTPTAWGRGILNAISCGVLFFVFWLLIAEFISLISHRSLAESFWLGFGVLWALIFLLFLGTWLYGLRTGGPVLLDCGPHPARVVFLFNAALWLVMGLSGVMTFGSSLRSFPLFSPMCGISIAVYFLIMATGRLQVREGGLWQYWSLLRWDKIESIGWSGDSTLRVKAKSRLPFLGRGPLPVPPEEKLAIHELLQKHCPVWDRGL